MLIYDTDKGQSAVDSMITAIGRENDGRQDGRSWEARQVGRLTMMLGRLTLDPQNFKKKNKIFENNALVVDNVSTNFFKLIISLFIHFKL